VDCSLWRVSTLRLSWRLGRANTFDVYLRVINKSKRTCCVYHANDFNPGPTSAGVFLCLKNLNIDLSNGFGGALWPCGSGTFRIY
jgi:hypothetical protein